LIEVLKKEAICCYLRVFGMLTGAILRIYLVEIFAKSGRTLSIGVDKQVPHGFKCTKLRRAVYRSAVSAKHPISTVSTVWRIIHRIYEKKRIAEENNSFGIVSFFKIV